MIKMTKHAQKRIQQRGISQETLRIIMDHGRIGNASNGVYKLFFGNKEYSNAINRLKQLIKSLERARGGTIILKEEVITVYKNNVN